MIDQWPHNLKEAQDYIDSCGYKLLSDDYKGIHGKLDFIDKYGYLYYSSITDLSKTGKSRPFHPGNPYTIKNIQTYITNYNLDFQLLSEQYTDNSTPLEFKCPNCGTPFSGRGLI